MPRVTTVNAARKDYPDHGIKKGDTYYWWKFRFGPVHKSKIYPKRQQLTQSAFLQALYDAEDALGGMCCFDDIAEIVDQLQGMRDECEESLENMPEGLRDSSDSGILLQERIDGLESAISELEQFEEPTREDYEDDDAYDEAISDVIEEAQSTSFDF